MTNKKLLNILYDIKNHIFFLGTMHFGKESAKIVIDSISSLNLDCVMIELDEIRYQNLLNESETIENNLNTEKEEKKVINSDQNHTPGSNNEEFFDFLIEIQQKLGKMLGLIPGIEMLAAINAVKQQEIKIKLIDQSILNTFQRMEELQKEIRIEQSDIIENFKKEQLFENKSEIQELFTELKKPGFIDDLIQEFKKNYPNLTNVLISERNEYMANKIFDYIKKNPNHRILIIVGAGHLKELIQITKTKLK